VHSVRAPRDLRRYTIPAIVNNQEGQVSVATDESQQTNVVKKSKKKRAKVHRFMYGSDPD
jgi:hypothetical protein